MALRSHLFLRGGLMATVVFGVLLHAPAARADEIPAASTARTASTVHLTLQSDREGTALLGTYAPLGARASYFTVCVAPCIADVDPRATYMIAGEGVTPSSRFRLPEGQSPSLRVNAGSFAMNHGGGTALLSGVVFGVVGTAFLLGSKLTEPSDLDARVAPKSALADQESSATRFRTIGYVGLAASASAIILGLVLIFTTQTDVFSGSEPIASAAPKKLALTPTGLVF